MQVNKILLAAGGTAGHVEPALAVARWVRANHPDITIEFLGTAEGLEKELVPAAGFTLRLITKAPMPRSLKVKSLIWPFKYLQSLYQTNIALNGVDLLVGFGGYVSSSAYLMGRFRGIPMYAHEANALPGHANTLGLRCGAEPLIAFEGTRKRSKKWGSARYVGIPLRDSIVWASRADSTERLEIRRRKANEWGFNPDRPIVAVFGGSLGSIHINNVIADSLKEITGAGIQVVHAVGKKNEVPKSQPGYKALSYFDDLDLIYLAADLVIARSGAVTCHELSAIGAYAILIPLAIGNGEQRLNAQDLVERGGATLVTNIDFTSAWLGANLIGALTAAKKYRESFTGSAVPLDATERIGEAIFYGR